MDTPNGYAPQPVQLCNAMFGQGGQNFTAVGLTATPSSGAWPVQNLAMFVPFNIVSPYVVRRVGFINGGTNVASSTEVGIYTLTGTKIWSSGTILSNGTASQPHWETPANPLILPPGLYLYALACNSATQTFQKTTITAVQGRMMGLMQQTTAFNLPAAATFAQFAQIYLPTVMISSHASY